MLNNFFLNITFLHEKRASKHVSTPHTIFAGKFVPGFHIMRPFRPPHLGKKPGTIWPTKLDIQLDVQFYKIIFKQCLNLILAPPFFKKVDFF